MARDVLDQIYKLYVRPHLDFGDIIYHKYDPEMRLTFTQRLKQAQYSAALAVAGAWRGTNRQRLYEELGWESLYHRRWFRRLCHFFNLVKSQSLDYLFHEIPPERYVCYVISYGLRYPRDYEVKVARTNCFSNTYFHNTLFEWNLVDEEIKNSTPLFQFKNKLLKMTRPEGNPVYNISDNGGVRLFTKLRLKFSVLNEHKFRHNFDSLTPYCVCGTDREDNEHFLLHCPLFDSMRLDLFDQLSEIPVLNVNLDDKSFCDLLLFRGSHYNVIINRIILEATILFIKNTKRLNGVEFSRKAAAAFFFYFPFFPVMFVPGVL